MHLITEQHITLLLNCLSCILLKFFPVLMSFSFSIYCLSSSKLSISCVISVDILTTLDISDFHVPEVVSLSTPTFSVVGDCSPASSQLRRGSHVFLCPSFFLSLMRHTLSFSKGSTREINFPRVCLKIDALRNYKLINSY